MSYKFYDDISFDNYATKWHVDHVIPLKFFDLTDKIQRQQCFHWTNLQPLDIQSNYAKSDSIIQEMVLKHAQTIKEFINRYDGYQTNVETCWWQRAELWYGKNPKDEEDFESFLKRAIRSQAPNPENDKGTEKVQRLNVSGSEGSSQS